ncbi:MAG TPA: hypothetical protein VK634_14945, partial [Reyranella sp.]|nr:hypothetical protein [Reyranella sp.]
MGKERSGWTNGARHGLRFYARCAEEAWRRSWDAANAWPPVLAVLLLSGSAWLAGADLTYPGDTAYGAPIGTGLFIVIAWLAVFLVQLVTAPPRLYARLDAELLALTRRLFAPSMRSVATLPAPVPVLRAPVLPAPVLPSPVWPDAALPVIALPGPESTPVPLLPIDPQPDLQSEPDPVVPPLTPAATRTALPP